MDNFKCGKCDEKFEERSDAIQHMSVSHPEMPSTVVELEKSPNQTQAEESSSNTIDARVVRHPKDPLKDQALGSR